MTLHIRAPDHLGDGVVALDAVAALARAFPGARVYAPRWGEALYGFLGVEVRPAAERPEAGVGVLFKPSFGAAWRWRHLERRVGLATAGRGLLLTEAVPVRVEHRRDGCRRVAEALGAAVTPTPYTPRGRAPDLPAGGVGLNPWSPSPTVRWPRFPALDQALRARGEDPTWFAGPGEEAEVRALAGEGRLLAGLSLPDFAAALDRCRVFVSNDSGAAHFAAACGTPVVMVHGSTAAARTGTGVAVEPGAMWCRPCYRKGCFRGLACLDRVDVAAVLAAIDGVGPRGG